MRPLLSLCPELLSAAPRLMYAVGLSGLRAMASRQVLASLRMSSIAPYRRPPSASSFEYASPVRAAMRACSSAASRYRCSPAPPSSSLFRSFRSCLVEHPVQLPSARVRRAVLAAQVRRRQLQVEALVGCRRSGASPGRRPCLTAVRQGSTAFGERGKLHGKTQISLLLAYLRVLVGPAACDRRSGYLTARGALVEARLARRTVSSVSPAIWRSTSKSTLGCLPQ